MSIEAVAAGMWIVIVVVMIVGVGVLVRTPRAEAPPEDEAPPPPPPASVPTHRYGACEPEDAPLWVCEGCGAVWTDGRRVGRAAGWLYRKAGQ